MNAKNTLIIAFAKGLNEGKRRGLLEDILKVEGVDTVAPGTFPVVAINEIHSLQKIRLDIMSIDGVSGVYTPAVSEYFKSDMPKP